MACFGSLWIARSNALTGLPGSPPLFPVTQRAESNIDHGRELGLDQAGGCTDFPRLQRAQGKRPRGLRFAVVDFIPLLDAFQQTFDEFAHGDYRHHRLPAACREALTRPIATI
ncbi:hypothetical protein N878_00840 [Pseudomonas sp. EGD-AK9]|nr:hypothetical protein N878_00840 [Pseudomonas sp. EGD-AK9]